MSNKKIPFVENLLFIQVDKSVDFREKFENQHNE